MELKYATDSYLTAYSMTLEAILGVLDARQPGARTAIVNTVARQISERLESGEDQRLKEALYIVAEMDGSGPSLDEIPANDGKPRAQELWLIDPDYAPATLEGQAAARLAVTTIMQVLEHLNGGTPLDKIAKKVLHDVFMAYSDRKDDKPHVLNDEVQWQLTQFIRQFGGREPLPLDEKVVLRKRRAQSQAG